MIVLLSQPATFGTETFFYSGSTMVDLLPVAATLATWAVDYSGYQYFLHKLQATFLSCEIFSWSSTRYWENQESHDL